MVEYDRRLPMAGPGMYLIRFDSIRFSIRTDSQVVIRFDSQI